MADGSIHMYRTDMRVLTMFSSHYRQESNIRDLNEKVQPYHTYLQDAI